MQAGAVADDGERRHSLPKGHGVEPYKRGSRPRPRRRRPTQSLRPPRRVFQSAPSTPQEHRRSRRAAGRLVQLIKRPASAHSRLPRTGRSHLDAGALIVSIERRLPLAAGVRVGCECEVLSFPSARTAVAGKRERCLQTASAGF